MNEIPIYRNPNPQPPLNTEPSRKPPKKKVSKELTSTLAIIIAAPLIAFVLTVFVFQSYEVDGPSMETTLQNKDRLIVNKMGRTWANIIGDNYLPSRYEIIVFNYSGSASSGGSKQLIKRVIGLPGDRVVVKDGVVTIYNDKNPDGFKPDIEGPENGAITTTDGNIDEKVEKGEVFVMGDNRENSLDSRVFGPIDTSQIVGDLALRIYPLDKIERF
jgi:signal peptidase I